MVAIRPLGLILGLTLTASACGARTAHIEVPQATTTVPANWDWTAAGIDTSAPAPDLASWWVTLGDPALTRLIGEALQRNPDVRTAEARLRQARVEQQIAGAALLPTVSAGAGVSDARGRALTFSPGFDASWEPDVFGGTGASVIAATADAAATTDDLRAVQVSLSGEVGRIYVQLRTAQQRIALLRTNVDAQSQTLQLTELRAQAGLVSSIDVEQARTSLEQSRAQIPALESTIARAMHRLAVLTGKPPGSLLQELAEVAAVPAVPDRVTIGIPAETLRQRPDVRAAEQRITAEAARLASARTRRLPQFSLTGSLGTDIVAQAATGGAALAASAAGSLLQTLFDGGRIRQQIAVQSAVVDQRIDAYQGTLLTALEDVENALVALETSRQRLDSLRTAQQAAEDAARLAQAQYAAGLVDFQRVLDTQRTVLSVQDNVATTEGDRTTSLVQLFKALGGGWSASGDSGPVSRSDAQ